MPYNETSKTIHSNAEYAITLYDIARGLNDYRVDTNGARNLGMLATSPKINKWAMYQPFEALGGNPYGIQTEEDRINSAYGFYWWNVLREAKAPFATSAAELMDKAKINNGEWEKRPVTIFRQADFDGYRHDAIMPYDYYVTPQPMGQTVMAYLYSLYNYDGNIEAGNERAELSMSIMPRIPDFGAIGSFSVKFLYRPVEGGEVTVIDELLLTGASQAGYVDAYDVDDVESATARFDAPILVGAESSQQYETLWACMWENDKGQVWAYYPNSRGSFTIGKNFFAYLWKFSAKNVNGVEIDSTQPDLSGNIGNISLDMRFINKLVFPIYASLKVKVWNAGDYANAREYESGNNISASQTVFIPMANLLPANAAVASQIYMSIDIAYTTNSEQTEWMYGHYDFKTNKLFAGEATEADGVTVAKIKTQDFDL